MPQRYGGVSTTSRITYGVPGIRNSRNSADVKERLCCVCRNASHNPAMHPTKRSLPHRSAIFIVKRYDPPAILASVQLRMAGVELGFVPREVRSNDGLSLAMGNSVTLTNGRETQRA